jgi:hypothetical protein
VGYEGHFRGGGGEGVSCLRPIDWTSIARQLPWAGSSSHTGKETRK